MNQLQLLLLSLLLPLLPSRLQRLLLRRLPSHLLLQLRLERLSQRLRQVQHRNHPWSLRQLLAANLVTIFLLALSLALSPQSPLSSILGLQ